MNFNIFKSLDVGLLQNLPILFNVVFVFPLILLVLCCNQVFYVRLLEWIVNPKVNDQWELVSESRSLGLGQLYILSVRHHGNQHVQQSDRHQSGWNKQHCCQNMLHGVPRGCQCARLEILKFEILVHNKSEHILGSSEPWWVLWGITYFQVVQEQLVSADEVVSRSEERL